MKFKNIILNLLVFSILIGGFAFVFFNTKKSAEANTSLVYCVKIVNPSTSTTSVRIYDSNTSTYFFVDGNKYFIIDSIYACPVGYQAFPSNFNIKLLQYATTTDIILPDGVSSGAATSSTSTVPGYDNLSYLNNDLQAIYDSIIYGSPDYNYNNPNYYYPNYNSPDYNYNNPNYSGTDYYGNPNYGNPNYSGTDYYNNPNYNNTQGGTGNIPGGGLNYQSLFLSSAFWNSLIKDDPSFTNGRFINLDPLDYPYCVVLTRNFGYGSRDGDTGREVSALQGYLYSRGYMDVEPTGYFGHITAISLGKFQFRNQITVTGSVNQEVRDVMKELTCIKLPTVSYNDKPISPAPYVSTTKTTTTVTTTTNTKPKPTTPTPPKEPVVTIPTTDDKTPENNTGMSTLSSTEGNMYLSQRNNLYFLFRTRAPRPYICMTLNNTDCTISSNYAPVIEGVLRNFYEVVDLSGNWAFSLYNGPTWGQPGDKVKIYFKESQVSNTVAIYTVNVLN